ncbi:MULTISPECIES: Hpt domain-containing protein [unclassified Acinetobacter]|uniref:Hpt domain-containing protein n=1 Tax=unclassified Acinetobacter TaxID=196816 RepID=UPI0035B9C381
MNEHVRQLVSQIELPTDHLIDQDPDIREIFVEEVEEIIELLEEAIPNWIENPDQQAVLKDIRRAYHTLKGSGRMAGALQSGELAWSVEELLNRVIADSVPLNNDIQKLVLSVAKLYENYLIQDFKDVAIHQVEFRPFILAAKMLRDGTPLDEDLEYTVNYYKDLQLPNMSDSDETQNAVTEIDLGVGSEIDLAHTHHTDNIADNIEIITPIHQDVVSEHSMDTETDAIETEASSLSQEDAASVSHLTKTVRFDDVLRFDDNTPLPLDDDLDEVLSKDSPNLSQSKDIFNLDYSKNNKYSTDQANEVIRFDDNTPLDEIDLDEQSCELNADKDQQVLDRTDEIIRFDDNTPLNDIDVDEQSCQLNADNNKQVPFEGLDNLFNAKSGQTIAVQPKNAVEEHLEQLKQQANQDNHTEHSVSNNFVSDDFADDLSHSEIESTLLDTESFEHNAESETSIVADETRSKEQIEENSFDNIELADDELTIQPLDLAEESTAITTELEHDSHVSSDNPQDLKLDVSAIDDNEHAVAYYSDSSDALPAVNETVNSTQDLELINDEVNSSVLNLEKEHIALDLDTESDDASDLISHTESHQELDQPSDQATNNTVVLSTEKESLILYTSSKNIQNTDYRDATDPTLDIYYEETAEHLDTIFKYLRFKKKPSISQINDIVRAVHTIRGSSGMVGIQNIFQHSTAVETIFKRIHQSEAFKDLNIENQLLDSYYRYVKSYITTYSIDATSSKLDKLYDEFENALANYNEYHDKFSKEDAELQQQGLVTSLLQLDIDNLLDAEFEFVQKARLDLESYIAILLKEADDLEKNTKTRQAEVLDKVIVSLKRIYQSILACYEVYPDVSMDVELLERIQALHHYLISGFDGLASGQNMIITMSIEEDFEQALEAIQRFGRPDLSPAEEAGVDEMTYESFLRDAEDLAVMIDYDFNDWVKHKEKSKAQQLFRYLHTLKGLTATINATQLNELADELENVYAYIWRADLDVSDEQLTTLVTAKDSIQETVEQLKSKFVDHVDSHLIENLRSISDDLYAELRANEVPEDESSDENKDHVVKHSNTDNLVQSVVESQSYNEQTQKDVDLTSNLVPLEQDSGDANTEFDADLLDIFLEEADELVLGMDKDFDAWEKEPTNTKVLNNLFRYLHTLKGGANMVQATYLGEIAHELETIYDRVLKGMLKPSAASMNMIRYAQDEIATRLQRLREESIDQANPNLLLNLQMIATGKEASVSIEATAPVEPKAALVQETADTESKETVKAEAKVEKDELTQLIESGIPPLLARALVADDDVQRTIAESFLEESHELLAQGKKYNSLWYNERTNRNVLLVLQRTYHTLKGSARVAGLDKVADMCYHLEHFYGQVLITGFQSERYDHLLNQAHGWLELAIFQGKEDGKKYLLSQFANISYEESVIDYSTEDLLNNTANETIVPTTRLIGDGSTPPAMYSVVEKTQDQQAGEPIRISPDLVEKMIDLSGENAINRSRVEMDLGQMSFALGEMEQTILRLADQLRRMDGELESQILTKHHEVSTQRYDTFDPLEMDQYSALNQLSKSLSESASDLIDFKNTIAEKIRDTEDLLVQQSRIQSELQQSLMGTRLVPFDRMIPRLQRLVRQTSTQLNRPVELHIENTEGELDRSILERLNSPFEHMLRNAIDHGIEDQEDRIKAGKSRTGHIHLSIRREGNDIIVSMQDDGKGIDVAKVRAKAEKNGLIDANAEISDHEMIQYIFHAGLSTADSVTAISGRGVGLDVVISEIKELGGDVVVRSEQGVGTTFEIRVPTTVAVTDALMVKVGDQQFAIPLSQIERITRIAPEQLQAYFNSQNDYFEIDEKQYRLRYVGEFINGQAKPVLNHLGSSVPVIIFNSAGRTIALQVDQLIGSRAQIVIKSIGKQMSSVGFIAGATILADGRVCLILDGQNIARRVLSSTRSRDVQNTTHAARSNTSRQLVMVVDDSVTVRKVTSRLLERHGYEVATAKDGLDAVEKLSSVQPDLMLLDIEMPRMDGFEVANYVRTGYQDRNLPIIMITSRTGEKHREHALSLGVDRYMGKPFQETELLATIQALLETEKADALT